MARISSAERANPSGAAVARTKWPPSPGPARPAVARRSGGGKPRLDQVVARGERAPVARDRGQELLTAQRHEVDVGARHDRGRARDLAQQRDLAEAVARELGAAEAPALGHLDLARGDHVEALAGLALLDDRPARRD